MISNVKKLTLTAQYTETGTTKRVDRYEVTFDGNTPDELRYEADMAGNSSVFRTSVEDDLLVHYKAFEDGTGSVVATILVNKIPSTYVELPLSPEDIAYLNGFIDN